MHLIILCTQIQKELTPLRLLNQSKEENIFYSFAELNKTLVFVIILLPLIQPFLREKTVLFHLSVFTQIDTKQTPTLLTLDLKV